MSPSNRQVLTPYDSLTYQIIGCAMAVHRNLGPGLRENTYQRALAVSLVEANLSYEPQKLLEVYDRPMNGQLVGYYIPDFIVEDKIIVEIKALSNLDNTHLAQLIGYLAVTGCPIGLLINFGERSLRYRRVFPPKKVSEHIINRQWLFQPDWLKEKQKPSTDSEADFTD
jgi:GxxExxY protein